MLLYIKKQTGRINNKDVSVNSRINIINYGTVWETFRLVQKYYARLFESVAIYS